MNEAQKLEHLNTTEGIQQSVLSYKYDVKDTKESLAFDLKNIKTQLVEGYCQFNEDGSGRLCRHFHLSWQQIEFSNSEFQSLNCILLYHYFQFCIFVQMKLRCTARKFG